MMNAFSLRTKVILLCLASISLLGFGLAAVTALAAHSLNRHILDAAEELAAGQAKQLSAQLQEMLSRQQLESLKQLDVEQLESQVTSILRINGDIVNVSVVGAGDELVIERYSEVPAHVASEIDQFRQRKLVIPVEFQDRELGQVNVTVSERLVLERIARAGGRMTEWLTALTAALFVLMVLAFVLLWKIFQRYLRLQGVGQQRERMAYVGMLAGGLAHEIRNPLNAINLNLDVIREEIEDPREDSPKRTHELVRLLQTETRQLNTTLTNFLTFALPGKAEYVSCDLSAILGETLALLQPELKKQGAEYALEAPRSVMLEADGAGLRQVFMNVLLNALQALDESVEKLLTVAVEVHSPHCRIRISDTGRGIVAADWEKAFEAFHSTRPGGTGFGLAIARRIVEDHGGEIRVAASSERGTTLEIVLPLNSPDK